MQIFYFEMFETIWKLYFPLKSKISKKHYLFFFRQWIKNAKLYMRWFLHELEEAKSNYTKATNLYFKALKH